MRSDRLSALSFVMPRESGAPRKRERRDTAPVAITGSPVEPVIGPRFARTRWRAMTMVRYRDRSKNHHALVSRFRSSPQLAADSNANFGIDKDTSNFMTLVPPLNPKFAPDLAARRERT